MGSCNPTVSFSLTLGLNCQSQRRYNFYNRNQTNLTISDLWYWLIDYDDSRSEIYVQPIKVVVYLNNQNGSNN